MSSFNFLSRNQIIELLDNADDIVETKRLISKFENLKFSRNPFYLTENDFEEILKWKLRSQYGRQKTQRQKNTTQIIEIVTKAAFSIGHINKDIEAYFKLRMLRTLVGVETAVASAILTLCFPNDFGVIDFRIWRTLFGEKKTFFTSSDYQRYISELRRLSLEHGFTIQQIDQAIWQYDIESNKLRPT